MERDDREDSGRGSGRRGRPYRAGAAERSPSREDDPRWKSPRPGSAHSGKAGRAGQQLAGRSGSRGGSARARSDVPRREPAAGGGRPARRSAGAGPGAGGQVDRVSRARLSEPAIPEDVRPEELDAAVRSRLRTLSKQNAEGVARHLVMAGRLLEVDPELAYEHAQAAVRRAGRVDVVREAAGITAYRTERYAEALRELRTVRRLNGSHEHLPLMADCERGLGRPERALAVAEDEGAATLSAEGRIELAIVVCGARIDLGDPEAALAVLSTPLVRSAVGETAVRVAQARAQALEAAGRGDEARELLAAVGVGAPGDRGNPTGLIDLIDLDPEADSAGAAVQLSDGPDGSKQRAQGRGTSEQGAGAGSPERGRGHARGK